jgi:hypothetical protein
MRHLVTAGFVVGALVAYSFGFEQGSGILFLIGAAFELVSLNRFRNRSASGR